MEIEIKADKSGTSDPQAPQETLCSSRSLILLGDWAHNILALQVAVKQRHWGHLWGEKSNVTQLKEFRQQVYTLFPDQADALMDLLDSLSSNTRARSVIELSLSSAFRRGYSSVPDGIDNFFRATDVEQTSVERRVQDKTLVRLIARQLRPPVQRKFWLFGLDTTPQPRPFADTLGDRTYVYQPNGVIKGNKPVTIGHEYSVLVHFPEKAQTTVDSAGHQHREQTGGGGRTNPGAADGRDAAVSPATAWKSKTAPTAWPRFWGGWPTTPPWSQSNGNP